MELKLEIGKRYINGDGWISQPVQKKTNKEDLDDKYIFFCGRESFDRNGFYYEKDCPSEKDLLSEYNEWNLTADKKPTAADAMGESLEGSDIGMVLALNKYDGLTFSHWDSLDETDVAWMAIPGFMVPDEVKEEMAETDQFLQWYEQFLPDLKECVAREAYDAIISNSK